VHPFWFIGQIILEFKGNELTWQNRKGESIEQFKNVQRKWIYWGIAFLLSFLLPELICLNEQSNVITKSED
jgi:hypothetical protein